MTEPIILQEYNSLAENCSSKLDTSSASQIIINGVDVSECKHYSVVEYSNSNNGYLEIRNYCSIYTNNQCEQNPNCYYKQLKKTQQELQQAMDNYVKATNYYEDKLAQIKRIINEVENV